MLNPQKAECRHAYLGLGPTRQWRRTDRLINNPGLWALKCCQLNSWHICTQSCWSEPGWTPSHWRSSPLSHLGCFPPWPSVGNTLSLFLNSLLNPDHHYVWPCKYRIGGRLATLILTAVSKQTGRTTTQILMPVLRQSAQCWVHTWILSTIPYHTRMNHYPRHQRSDEVFSGFSILFSLGGAEHTWLYECWARTLPRSWAANPV